MAGFINIVDIKPVQEGPGTSVFHIIFNRNIQTVQICCVRSHVTVIIFPETTWIEWLVSAICSCVIYDVCSNTVIKTILRVIGAHKHGCFPFRSLYVHGEACVYSNLLFVTTVI